MNNRLSFMPKVKVLKFIILLIISVLLIVFTPSLVTSVFSAPKLSKESCGTFESPCYVELDRIQNLIDQGYLLQASEHLTNIEPFLPEQFKPIAQAIAANLALRSGRYQQAIDLLLPLTQLENLEGENRATLFYNLAQAYLDRAYVYQQQGESSDPARSREFNKQINSDRLQAIKLLQEILLNVSPEKAIAISASLKLGELGETVDLQFMSSAILNYPQGLEKIEFLINLAELRGVDSRSHLLEAIKVAQQIDQPLGKSWAWGYFGEYLLKHEEYQGAIQASIKAQRLIQNNSDWRLMARWENLAATAYSKLGDKDNALKIYELAFYSIKKLRKQLAGSAINPELIDEIQSVLRNYLKFLLENPEPYKAKLKKAVEILNLTSLTEIERYFKTVCNINSEVTTETAQDKPTSSEAFIYTAILDKQFSIIAQLPDGSYRLTSHPIQKEDLNKIIIAWRKQLADRFGKDIINTRNNSKILFDLIIAPTLSNLNSYKINHLTFINDGLLRNVPMAALSDGNKYLTEYFLISYSSGARNIKSQQISFPSFSVIVNAEPNLTGVQKEEQQLALITEGENIIINSLIDLNNKLQTKAYELLHLATDSQFSGLIEETSITIGEQSVGWTDFENFLLSLSKPIKFLTLSSCETAQGNQYAALGLAGLGLRTGISSVLGSLWKIDDEATAEFMGDFYSNWKATNNIAKALQLAQIKRIKQKYQIDRPAYWSGFVVLH